MSKHARPSWFARHIRPIRLPLIAAAVATMLITQIGVVSNATWNDSEWVHDTIGTASCDTPGVFASRGEGRLLSGSLLATNLDTLAEASGVTATNNGSRAQFDPVPPPETDVSSNSYQNPLNVEALSLIGLDLTGLLELPLETRTGVVGQYAKATPTSESVGASGTVTNDGGVSLEQFEGDVPGLATIDLDTLLKATGPGFDGLLANVADLSLTLGAVGGRAFLDGCGETWNEPNALRRDYVASHLDLDLESPTVEALATTVNDTLAGLATAIATLVGNESIVSGLVSSVMTLVSGVLSLPLSLLGYRLSTAEADPLVVTIDTTAVQSLLSEPFGDDFVNITLADGLVHVDTVALLEAAYHNNDPDADPLLNPYRAGLNNLTPNTNPLADPRVLSTLVNGVSSTLTALVSQVEAKLTQTINNAQILVNIEIPVERACQLFEECTLGTWSAFGDPLRISLNGSLNDFENNERSVIDLDLSTLSSIPLGSLLTTIVEDLTGGLLTLGILPALATTIKAPLSPLVTALTSSLNPLIQPVLTLVSTLYTELFLSGVVAVTINAQNDPRSGSPGSPGNGVPRIDPEPVEWSGLPDGQYNVSAIRVGVLDALGAAAVWLHLGHGSVGTTCSVSEVSTATSPCHTY